MLRMKQGFLKISAEEKFLPNLSKRRFSLLGNLSCYDPQKLDFCKIVGYIIFNLCSEE